MKQAARRWHAAIYSLLVRFMAAFMIVCLRLSCWLWTGLTCCGARRNDLEYQKPVDVQMSVTPSPPLSARPHPET
jgi:hypothetical protein